MVWMVIASLCAYFIKGLCGFANTLVFSSILSFQEDNINISPVELLLGYPTNVILAWRGRKAADWKVSLPLALLVLLGNIPGILLLKNVDTQQIKVLFGFVIVGLGVEMFGRERKKGRLRESKIVLAIIGIASGVLCGLFGIGALLAAYVSRVTDNSEAFKANICTVFVIENTFRIVMYTLSGIITTGTLRQAVMLIPAMLLGLYIGIKSSGHLDEKHVKTVVIVMLVISGAALIIENI